MISTKVDSTKTAETMLSNRKVFSPSVKVGIYTILITIPLIYILIYFNSTLVTYDILNIDVSGYQSALKLITEIVVIAKVSIVINTTYWFLYDIYTLTRYKDYSNNITLYILLKTFIMQIFIVVILALTCTGSFVNFQLMSYTWFSHGLIIADKAHAVLNILSFSEMYESIIAMFL